MNIKTEKPKFLNTKTGKTDLKNSLNCKTENPNAPSLKHDSIGQHLKQLFVRSIH